MSKTKKQNKFLKYFLPTAKWGYRLLSLLGAAAALTNPISAIAGIGIISSNISSIVKDKNWKPFMKTIGFLACNFDKARNDPKINK